MVNIPYSIPEPQEVHKFRDKKIINNRIMTGNTVICSIVE